MEDMVDRVVYWWVRYEGSHTEDGKEFSKGEVYGLANKLMNLSKNPDSFKFNKPDMLEEEGST